MAPTRKKVILRRLDNILLQGYLPVTGFLSPGRAALDLLDLEGRTLPVPLAEIKFVAYVRDFNLDDRHNPERLSRTAFLSRPRGEGLWLRLTFPAGDQLEGLAPLDHSLLDALVTDAGLFLTPPSLFSPGDARTNTQRLYVPRLAISALQLLAVVTAPSRKPAKPANDQPLLFGD